MSGTLYVVATPLGNLGDITRRAAEVLRAVTVVGAEDTRRARILLQSIDAKPRVVAVHQHSTPKRLAQMLAMLEEGTDVAMITDAGTPGISDPGAALVRRAHGRGFAVRAVPGPSAVTAAVSISGLPGDRYTFLGFPPRSGRARREVIAAAASSPWTSVMFEAPGRLVTLLRSLARACGPEREAAVARELTKVHEDLRHGTLADLVQHYTGHEPRGEVTVVIAGSGVRREDDRAADSEVREVARALLADGMTKRDAARRVAEDCRIPRNEAYRLVSEL